MIPVPVQHRSTVQGVSHHWCLFCGKVEVPPKRTCSTTKERMRALLSPLDSLFFLFTPFHPSKTSSMTTDPFRGDDFYKKNMAYERVQNLHERHICVPVILNKGKPLIRPILAFHSYGSFFNHKGTGIDTANVSTVSDTISEIP